MKEGERGLRVKIVKAVTGDRAVLGISFITGAGSIAAGINIQSRGIHTIEDVILWGGAATFAVGSALVFGLKTADLEKRDRR